MARRTQPRGAPTCRAWALANVDYLLSNGCSHMTAVGSPGTDPLFVFPFSQLPTDECLDSSAMSFLAVAVDATTGAAVAYAALAGHPRQSEAPCLGLASFNGWCVETMDWPEVAGVQWFAPQTV